MLHGVDVVEEREEGSVAVVTDLDVRGQPLELLRDWYFVQLYSAGLFHARSGPPLTLRTLQNSEG